MNILERLRDLEDQYAFVKWVSGNEYGKIVYAGDDFLEFNIIDVDSMEYRETVLLNFQLILEVNFGGSDISRIIAERSSQMPSTGE